MSGMQPTPPHTVERCKLLLEHWRSQLQLSPRDQGLLGGELRLLDRQLQRLRQRRLRIALFGRVGVGKSSLINALIRRPLLATDCLLYTSPSPRDLSTSRMPSSA